MADQSVSQKWDDVEEGELEYVEQRKKPVKWM